MKNTKKGFTLVELLVVIAILAILATVSIVGYTSFINRAHESNDNTLVAQLNSLLLADETLNGKGNVANAVKVAADGGYSVEKLTPTSEGNHIVYNEETNRFALVASDALPTDKQDDTWLFVEKYDTEKSLYSQYIYGTEVASPLNVAAGVAISTAADVNYTSELPHTVTIIMNGGKLTVNNPNGTVLSYGDKKEVEVEATALNSYHEFGRVIGVAMIKQGRFVAEKGSVVPQLNVDASATNVSILVKSGAELAIAKDESGKASLTVESGADFGIAQGFDESKVTGATVDNTEYGTRIGMNFYPTFAEALAEVKSGDTIVLLNDVDTGTEFLRSKINNVVWDLNGYTVSGSGEYVILNSKASNFTIKNGVVALESHGNEQAAIGLQGGSTIIENVTIELYGADYKPNRGVEMCSFAGYAGYETTTAVLNGVTIKQTVAGTAMQGTTGITLQGTNADDSVVLTLNDCSIETSGAAISGIGDAHGTKIEINGGKLHSTMTAIYHPQYGSLTINSGEVIGDQTGIEIRGGTLNINGGTIEGNGDPFESEANGTGSTVLGAAVAVSQHTTELPINVTISGGTIKGNIYSLYETDTVAESKDESYVPSENVSITIYDGTFIGELKAENVIITDNRK